VLKFLYALRINHLLKNADWYKGVFDKMIFEDFEELIREITGYKCPKRLI